MGYPYLLGRLSDFSVNLIDTGLKLSDEVGISGDLLASLSNSVGILYLLFSNSGCFSG